MTVVTVSVENGTVHFSAAQKWTWVNQLAWHADGGSIYSSDVSGSGDSDLFLTDARGGNPKRLTSDSGFNNFPSVTPDGRYIVFSRLPAKAPPSIWRMDIDGANQKQLTDKFDLDPHVSPDGQWFVYESWSGKLTLWKMPVEGGQPVHLTETRSWLGLFSPDGKLILAFQSKRTCPCESLFSRRLAGSPSRHSRLPRA